MRLHDIAGAASLPPPRRGQAEEAGAWPAVATTTT
jgi:hypothetical protein